MLRELEGLGYVRKERVSNSGKWCSSVPKACRVCRGLSSRLLDRSMRI